MALDIYVSKCGAVISPTRLVSPMFCPVCGEPLDAAAVEMWLSQQGPPPSDETVAAALEEQATQDLNHTTTDNRFGLEETV